MCQDSLGVLCHVPILRRPNTVVNDFLQGAILSLVASLPVDAPGDMLVQPTRDA